MYQHFYGFSEMPFNVTPDPNFLYLSPTHQEALAHLRYGIEERKGFIVLIGEVGCGKTTLCRALLNRLDSDRYETALILNPRINENQLLRAILRELGERIHEHEPVLQPTSTLARVVDDGDEQSDRAFHDASSTDLTERLNDALLRRIHAGKNIVLIIDEAQNLSFEVMEQLRLISNLETDNKKLLQIILIGQPELKTKISHKSLRQLKQRILVYYELHPLSFPETAVYIQHRLTLAGGMGRPRFTPWAIRRIYKRSSGIPRMINNICDRAILSAFIRNADEVNRRDVNRAVREMKHWS